MIYFVYGKAVPTGGWIALKHIGVIAESPLDALTKTGAKYHDFEYAVVDPDSPTVHRFRYVNTPHFQEITA